MTHTMFTRNANNETRFDSEYRLVADTSHSVTRITDDVRARARAMGKAGPRVLSRPDKRIPKYRRSAGRASRTIRAIVRAVHNSRGVFAYFRD